MQLNLTDYEAQLLEQRLRGRTVSFSDADYLMLTGIADRLLTREVGGRGGNEYVRGDLVQLSSVELKRLKQRVKGRLHHQRREGDEYACSCGARWDVSEEHP